MTNKPAQWIWYANDFELLAYHNMTKRRRQRKDLTYPTWVMDRPEYQVEFVYNYDVPEDTSFKIYANGEILINVDEKSWNEENCTEQIYIKKGKGIIRVYCFAETGIPTIFIDSKYIKTNSDWLCRCITNKLIHASCNDMFTTKNYGPVDYKLPTKKLNAVSVVRHGDGLLYDFGRELLGTPVIFSSKKKTFNIFYGESELEALDYENSEVCEDFCALRGKKCVGKESRGFRYIFIKNAQSLKDFYILEEIYKTNFKPYFKTNNKIINDVYKVAKYTLEVTSREFFIDGPKRDRWVWAGDALQSEWFDFYTFFDKDIVKRTLLALIGKQKIKSNINGILDYNFYYILTAYYYYYYTGDKEFIEKLYPRLVDLMQFVFTKPKVDGLLMAKNEWIFIDWANIKNFGVINNKYPICIIQILYYKALETMIKFEDVLGLEHNPKYQQEISGLKEKINQVYFDKELGGYYHDTAHTLKTKYGNIFAVLFDFADEKQKESISKIISSSDFAEIYTPYMKFYELCAHAECGNIDYVLDYLDYYWGGMVRQGTTTFWEKYEPEQTGPEKYAMYGRKYGKSLCHSWGAGPLYLLGKYVVGLAPAEEKFNEYKLNPYLSNLTFKTKLPLNGGEIKVEYNGKTLSIFSKDKDGILVGNDKIDCSNLSFDQNKGGYILAKGVKHTIRVNGGYTNE